MSFNSKIAQGLFSQLNNTLASNGVSITKIFLA